MERPSDLPSLTVVIPLYREEEGVSDLAAALDSFAAGTERGVDFVLVDDGSTDATGDRLRAEFDGRPDATILVHPHNLGLGAALETGGLAARGDYVAWLDADLTYDPAVLADLAAALDAGADVALTSCYHPDGGVEGIPPWRLALSRTASSVYRRATRSPLHTYTSMVRAYRREVLERCRPRWGGFLAVTEVLLRAVRQKARCVEVPTVLRRRRTGQSKMRIVSVALGHVGLLLTLLCRGLDKPSHS